MFVVVAKYLIPKGYKGWTAFPFVLIKCRADKEDKVFINHEKIHLRQQLELLIVPFYIWYLLEFAIRVVQYRSTNSAYKNISFEREAYCNESDLSYLKKRTFFRFVTYLSLEKK